MQIQKEENRIRILQAATLEFSENGYRRASMREIAKQAGMTVGNIYAYFQSKDALFDAVVSPTVKQLETLIFDVPLPRFSQRSPLRDIAYAVSQLYRENRVQFLILMNGAKGSAFEDAKEQITQAVCRRIWNERHMLPESFRENSVLTDALGHSLIEALVYLLLHSEDGGYPLEESLDQYLSYLFVNKQPDCPAESE
jgi:AcrR family transcriptional regulator